MENISYVGLSQQLVLQREIEITANNLANMNTPGYQAQAPLFIDYVNQAGNRFEGSVLHQVMDVSTYRNLNQGSLTQTFNQFDFAIQGEGYFAVQTSNGTQYTRDGGFSLNEQNQLVTKMGYPVMGDGGPIVVPQEAVNVTLSQDGTLSSEQGQFGKVKVVTFDNQQKLTPMGDNLFDANGMGEQAPKRVRLAQGMIEGSNVNPILEMNKLIEASRMYQSVQQMLQTDHQRQRTTIQQLTKV
jgi:flagellar basal-body rod protein FlgF